MSWLVAFFLWLRSATASVPRRLAALWRPREPKLLYAARVEEFPERLEQSRIYLAGEGDNLWAASMICPCGCGEIIELNLLPQVRPCWSSQQHADGTISLKPSVWRQKGCRSHFVVRHGRIEWC